MGDEIKELVEWLDERDPDKAALVQALHADYVWSRDEIKRLREIIEFLEVRAAADEDRLRLSADRALVTRNICKDALVAETEDPTND